MKLHWTLFTKYREAFTYIQEHRPKLIVEYGIGISTYYIDMLLTELDYGGRVIGFESEKKWFDVHEKHGYNSKGNARLVPVEIIDKEKGYVEYMHSYSDLKEVDMVIIDGPDYRIYTNDNGSPSNVTLNLQRLVEYKGEEIPYFIDGRTGCLRYYNEICGYSTHIEQLPE